jgi:hypothetical protein
LTAISAESNDFKFGCNRFWGKSISVDVDATDMLTDASEEVSDGSEMFERIFLVFHACKNNLGYKPVSFEM